MLWIKRGARLAPAVSLALLLFGGVASAYGQGGGLDFGRTRLPAQPRPQRTPAPPVPATPPPPQETQQAVSISPEAAQYNGDVEKYHRQLDALRREHDEIVRDLSSTPDYYKDTRDFHAGRLEANQFEMDTVTGKLESAEKAATRAAADQAAREAAARAAAERAAREAAARAAAERAIRERQVREKLFLDHDRPPVEKSRDAPRESIDHAGHIS